MGKSLVFLKLGGSLITVKNKPHTPRLEVMGRLAGEIREAMEADKGLQIVLGHGSGSFGHAAADRYQTRRGVKRAEDWKGFIEVWRQAAELNQLVMQTVEKAGLTAMAFPPSASIVTQNGEVVSWDVDPIIHALEAGLKPVIYGDVVFDDVLGGTILSTEDLFAHLAQQLKPERILLAGDQPGVWKDYPANTRLFDEITPENYSQIESGLSGSAATDVTGGMAEKVRRAVSMVQSVSGLRAYIFSGEEPGNVRRALLGEPLGTRLQSQAKTEG